MSMLAEPRRKQKWTLNPRGKQWSEDSEKFGQKMLERMGWSSGKGLGANEQGITEHVRVSFKNDTAGIGFKRDGLDEAWTENQDSFNHFLQELQKGQNTNVIQVNEKEIKTESHEKSLELKSKRSKARVHYHKFTRGKDVNRYSSKDLANIFGQKELNVNKNVKESENNNLEYSDTNPVGTQDNNGSFITLHGGNMTDYFQKKGQNFSLTPKKRIQRENNSESESEYIGFGFATKKQSNDSVEKKKRDNVCNYAFENPCLKLGSPENISNMNIKLEYSKKRKISDNSESSVNNDPKKFKDDVKSGYKNAFVNAALNLEPTINEACNGKEFEVSRIQFGVTNSALDLHDEVTDKKRVTFNDHVEYSTDSVSKKKGKIMLDKFEIENKKSKKKKKQDSTNVSVSLGIINEALDTEEISEEMNDNKVNERKNNKPKKRKSNHQLNLETIVEIPDEGKEANENEIEVEINKPNENILASAMPLKNHTTKKVQKKRKKDKNDEEITTINESNKLELPVTKVNGEIEIELNKEADNAPKQINKGDCCNVKKQKKFKKKNTEINVDDHEDSAKIQVKNNNTEHVKQETEKTREETVKLKKNKKKKSKDKDKKDVIVKLEQEISNKENENNELVSSSKEEKPKKMKREESMQENVESIPTTESTKEKSVKPTVNTKVTYPSSKNTRFNANSNPWSEKTKMSKKILMSLFYRNSIAHFPGANVEEIKGYGADIYNKE